MFGGVTIGWCYDKGNSAINTKSPQLVGQISGDVPVQ